MSDKSAVDDLKVIEDNKPVAHSKAETERTKAAEYYKNENTGDAQLSMNVRVHSPFRTYYDGDAFSLSAVNATGSFDILPRHHNFVSLLQPCELIVRSSEKGEQKFLISGGMLHVKADRVIVFLDI